CQAELPLLVLRLGTQYLNPGLTHHLRLIVAPVSSLPPSPSLCLQSAGSSIQSLPHGSLLQPASALTTLRFSASPAALPAPVSLRSRSSLFRSSRPCFCPWHPPSHFPIRFPFFPK
uniref:Uncharacterized protein n=1 Tax=Sander lucioperca TaxID=283035 RepID=A0A8C9WYA1_SANLU